MISKIEEVEGYFQDRVPVLLGGSLRDVRAEREQGGVLVDET